MSRPPGDREGPVVVEICEIEDIASPEEIDAAVRLIARILAGAYRARPGAGAGPGAA